MPQSTKEQYAEWFAAWKGFLDARTQAVEKAIEMLATRRPVPSVAEIEALIEKIAILGDMNSARERLRLAMDALNPTEQAIIRGLMKRDAEEQKIFLQRVRDEAQLNRMN